jgi:hypothetical protein
MLTRIWHGRTSPENAEAYERLLRTEVLPGIAARRIDGYRGAFLLRRELDGGPEFVTVMQFESPESVRSFAGEDAELAVVPPKARSLLDRYDERSAHYQTVLAPAAVDALLAAGPAPELAEELELYGRLVGEWDFDYSNHGADGQELVRTRGEWLFFWILEGHAVGDVWICAARDVRGTPDAPEAEPEYGMTVRFYDASLEGWRVVWSGPRYGAQQTFVARERAGDIVQEGTRTDGTQLQWIFSNITDRAFDWRSQVKEGGEWRIRERIAARRR